MSHFTVVVALPAGTEHAEAALEKVLAPYNENMDVPRYIKYTKAQAAAKEREEIIQYRDHGFYAEYIKDPVTYATQNGNNASHMRYLRTEFPEKLTHLDDDDWLYQQAIKWEEEEDLDEDGNITSTYNPKSKWDWWTIGGRWSGFFNATSLGMVKDDFFGGEYEEFDDDGVDIVRVGDLNTKKMRSPYAFVDLDGNWNEKGQMGWFGMSSNEKDPEDWDATYRRFVDSLDPDTTLVLVDAHI